ncbi:MAG: hypothetical protein ACRCW2_04715 [Cellulosilyticaceae bacterium]
MYCPICNTKLNGENFCPNCGQAIDYSQVPQAPTPEVQMPQQTNYAPTYNEVPPEIRKWNWGAFTFNIFWGIGNKTYLPLLCFIPYFNLIWIFVCGAKGNEWAWKSNNYSLEDVEKFLAIQNSWNRGGIAKFIFGIAGFFLALILIMVFSVLVFSMMGSFYY